MMCDPEWTALLSSSETLRQVEPSIYSVYPEGENTNEYDRMGDFYDAILCNPLYNRVVWGYSVADYASITYNVLQSTEGWILDAGCGSLAFTAKTYARYAKQPIILLDQSIKLLRMAKARLIKLVGHIPKNMTFLHGNVLDLPFNHGNFRSIISMNVIHVLPPEDLRRMLIELRNSIDEEGRIIFTTLVKNNRLADKYINLLEKSSQFYARSMPQLLKVFDDVSMPVKFEVKGSMAFILCAQSGSAIESGFESDPIVGER